MRYLKALVSQPWEAPRLCVHESFQIPHYVVEADGTKQLYILCHGWSAGKFAVLKHEPKGEPSVVKTWDLRPGKKGFN
jgi:hypothetical protein